MKKIINACGLACLSAWLPVLAGRLPAGPGWAARPGLLGLAAWAARPGLLGLAAWAARPGLSSMGWLAACLAWAAGCLPVPDCPP